MENYMVWAFIEEEENGFIYQDTSAPKLLGKFDNKTAARDYVSGIADAKIILTKQDLLSACRMAFAIIEKDKSLIGRMRSAIKKAGK